MKKLCTPAWLQRNSQAMKNLVEIGTLQDIQKTIADLVQGIPENEMRQGFFDTLTFLFNCEFRDMTIRDSMDSPHTPDLLLLFRNCLFVYGKKLVMVRKETELKDEAFSVFFALRMAQLEATVKARLEEAHANPNS